MVRGVAKIEVPAKEFGLGEEAIEVEEDFEVVGKEKIWIVGTKFGR